jgi:hypothetical protein
MGFQQQQVQKTAALRNTHSQGSMAAQSLPGATAHPLICTTRGVGDRTSSSSSRDRGLHSGQPSAREAVASARHQVQ